MQRAALLLALALGGCGTSSPSDAGADVPGTADAGAADVPSVADAAAGDTWASWGEGFFSTYCVACHAGPPSGRDYRTLDDVRRDAMLIRCGTTPRTEPLSGCGTRPAAGMFPVGGGPFPSDAERRRLVAWIDAGLPE